VTDDFKSTVTAGNKVYGAPLGTSFAGGILYNKKVYKQLGLTVPTSWADFMANSEKIKQQDPSVAPIIQAYGDDYTARSGCSPISRTWPTRTPNGQRSTTQHKVKYSQQPALAGFLHQEQVHAAGLFNKDFASIHNDQALTVLAERQGCSVPDPDQLRGRDRAEQPRPR